MYIGTYYICTDGAAAMTGKCNGLVTRFKLKKNHYHGHVSYNIIIPNLVCICKS